MPSKLRKAIGAVKDQTSISFAKITSTNASNLQVLILKATRHDDSPIDERYVTEVLSLISSSKACAVACAHVISKRIGRTRKWIVALKSLMLVLRIFQDNDPYFPREVRKRGARILNLSGFRDDSNKSPWDFTAFVRTFALYLDERLDCFITGKLQRSFTHRVRIGKFQPPKMYFNDNMKPPVLLDHIFYWQKLLDRVMATRPTGAAESNRLVHICLYAIVQESFDLYKDIYDGLALLVDSFFHLPHQSCATTFQACVRAMKQFEELSSFYNFCKSMGVGRASEYPNIKKISGELIGTLQEFLRDQASFPTVAGGGPSPSRRPEGEEEEVVAEGISSRTRQLSSLEDLMGLAGMEDQEVESPMSSENKDMIDAGKDIESSSSFSFDQGTRNTKGSSALDLLSLDDWDLEDLKLDNEKALENSNSGWEIVPVELEKQPSTEIPIGFFDLNGSENSGSSIGLEFGISATTSNQVPNHHYNPFLEDLDVQLPHIETESKPLSLPPTEEGKETIPVDDLFLGGDFLEDTTKV
ncbi:unnamed protein product [Linum tenue]|uniref:ENTH domain-containing protein n=1 Tax=Linum tenue TaxID=586396 RepID=A0AAV0NP89_9ROSI|nr:unnamed protein product [Linum tenue]